MFRRMSTALPKTCVKSLWLGGDQPDESEVHGLTEISSEANSTNAPFRGEQVPDESRDASRRNRRNGRNDVTLLIHGTTADTAESSGDHISPPLSSSSATILYIPGSCGSFKLRIVHRSLSPPYKLIPAPPSQRPPSITSPLRLSPIDRLVTSFTLPPLLCSESVTHIPSKTSSLWFHLRRPSP